MLKSRIFEAVKIGIGVALLTGGVVYAQTTWTGPTQAFPNGNVAAPINEGPVNQAKTGTITAAAFNTLGTSINVEGNGVGKFRKVSITDINNVEIAKITFGGIFSGTGLQVKPVGLTIVPGMVLTATDVNGNATWKTPVTGGSFTCANGQYLQGIDSNGPICKNAGPTEFFIIWSSYSENYGNCSESSLPSCSESGWKQLAQFCEGGDKYWYRWMVLCGK